MRLKIILWSLVCRHLRKLFRCSCVFWMILLLVSGAAFSLWVCCFPPLLLLGGVLSPCAFWVVMPSRHTLLIMVVTIMNKKWMHVSSIHWCLSNHIEGRGRRAAPSKARMQYHPTEAAAPKGRRRTTTELNLSTVNHNFFYLFTKIKLYFFSFQKKKKTAKGGRGKPHHKAPLPEKRRRGKHQYPEERRKSNATEKTTPPTGGGEPSGSTQQGNSTAQKETQRQHHPKRDEAGGGGGGK